MRLLSIGLLGVSLAMPGLDSHAAGSTARALDHPASIGSPTRGRLDGGARIIDNSYLHTVAYYASSGARWALPGFVALLDRTARGVAQRYPGASLAVGDLSREHGGDLLRHHSHESGRDADLGYYLVDATQRPLVADRFLAVDPDGSIRERPGASFDDARNWALLSGLLASTTTRVAQIFVAPHIRSRLLRYAERHGAPAELRQRAAELMLQPRGVPLHDDHFHVRVACPSGESGVCIETPQIVSTRARPAIARARTRSGGAW